MSREPTETDEAQSPALVSVSFYSVAQVAKIVGVSKGTIRAWEEQGLLSPRRDEHNRRMYSSEDLARLRKIQWWRRVRGVNAAAILAILNDDDDEGVQPGDGTYYRGLRIAAGLTLKEVSERSGLSVSFISSIERGIGAMSPTSRARIANAFVGNLRVDIQPRAGVHTAGTGRILEVAPGIHYEWLSESTGLLEPQLVTLSPGVASESAYQHDGEEFLFLLEGRLRLWLGRDEYVISQSESIHFSSFVVHRWANDVDATTRVLWVTTERGVRDDAHPRTEIQSEQ